MMHGKPLPDPIQELALIEGVDLRLESFATVANRTETTLNVSSNTYTQHLPELWFTLPPLSRKMQESDRYRQCWNSIVQMHEKITHDGTQNCVTLSGDKLTRNDVKDIRLGIQYILAMLRSSQRSSIKRVDEISSSDLAQFLH